MEVGDKVWTWTPWYAITQIEIRTIENMDGVNVVNNFILLDNLSYTTDAAIIKMKAFIRKRISAKKREIIYLEKILIRETKDEKSPNSR